MRCAAVLLLAGAACGDNLEMPSIDAPIDPGAQFDDTDAWVEPVRFTLGADRGHAQHRPGRDLGQEAKHYRRARTSAGALPLTLWVIQRTWFDMRPVWTP